MQHSPIGENPPILLFVNYRIINWLRLARGLQKHAAGRRGELKLHQEELSYGASNRMAKSGFVDQD